MRICELRQKEVINIRDCQRIGFVVDEMCIRDSCQAPIIFLFFGKPYNKIS